MTQQQFDLGFAAATDQPAPAHPRRARRLDPARAAPQQPANEVAGLRGGIPDSAEQLARTLQDHPDFRVQRRLVPQLHFPEVDAAYCQRVLLLDTETTGLDASRDRIIELALLAVAIDRRTGLPAGAVEVYDGLQDPGMPIPEIARNITGITDDMVRGQQLDETRIASMLEGSPLVIAHNAGFDRPFVEARLSAFAELPWACSIDDVDWKAEGRSSARLESLALDIGLFYDAHRAEMDCHALLAVLSGRLASSGATAMLKLLGRVDQPRFRLQATAAPFDAKDRLKERGYRWDPQLKVWQTLLPDPGALEAECGWLARAVYAGRSARVSIERLDAKVRYSRRPGIPELRSLP